MTTLENLVSPALTRALGWTLLHSLWQGALVAAVLAGALLLLRRHRAELRYTASAIALGLLVLVAGLTFARYYRAEAAVKAAPASRVIYPVVVPQSKPAAKPAAPIRWAAAGVATPPEAQAQAVASMAEAALVSPLSSWLGTALQYFDRHMPLLVLAWLLGLLAMSLRMLGGLLYVQRLRHYRVRPLGAAWQARLADLAGRAGLHRPVALLESALVQVPLVVGHVRPVILLPLGAVAGLSPGCLEAILAHELAHVLRRDYLVNLLQTVAEVLFFYHPAVWFMASCLRNERENCCDDTATALCGGDPLRLARALTALAEWSQSAVMPAAPRLALAAVGTRGSLLGRVRRLVQRRPAAPTLAEGLMAACLMLGGLGLLGGSVALAGPRSNSAAPRLAAPGLPFQAYALLGVTDTTKRASAANAASAIAAVPAFTLPEPSLSEEDIAALRESDDAAPLGDSARHRRPRVIVRRGGQPGPGASTVVIKKDKKGRITDLVVNGQRIESQGDQAKRKTKDKGDKQKSKSKDEARVEIIQVPGAASADAWVLEPGKLEYFKELGRLGELGKLGELGQLGQLGDLGQWEKFGKDFKYDFKLAPHYRIVPGDNFTFSYDADGHRLLSKADAERMRRDAGQAAERSIAAARRGLEAALRSPRLSKQERQKVQQALQGLERRQASPKRGRSADSRQREEMSADLADADQERAEEARERAEEARERAEELRERRQELQERIRETQEELRELEEARRESRYQADEEPPRPPRAPRAPQAPRAPRAPRASLAPMPPMPAPPMPPAPPKAPAPPAVSSTKVRDALRQDGIIGKTEKSYTFRLNAEGMTVNGQRQSAETEARYRKLLSMPKDGKSSRTISITENND